MLCSLSGSLRRGRAHRLHRRTGPSRQADPGPAGRGR